MTSPVAELRKKRKESSLSGVMNMEQDFTTVGSEQGQLGCPFANMDQLQPKSDMSHAEAVRSAYSQPGPRRPLKARSKRLSFNDPLKAGKVATIPPSPESSNTGSVPQCPIRFMDQHSPEEIAKYFEQHKHELPRSHEICVKRFQSNADSIRQLDAKYGNLVNMIQGLGAKHQPMLPEKNGTDVAVVEDEEDDSNNVEDFKQDEGRSNQKIQAWAEAVSNPPGQSTEDSDKIDQNDGEQEGEAERQGHFDRPMKDIRVGESPSRPWGVPIPSKYLDRMDADDSNESTPRAVKPFQESMQAPPKEQAPEPSKWEKAAEQDPKPKGKCPFDHEALARMKAGMKADQPVPEPKAEPLVVQRATNQGNGAEAEPSTKAPSRAKAPRTIVNYGVMAAPSIEHFGDSRIENYGSIIVGYDAAATKQLLESDQLGQYLPPSQDK